MLQSTLEQVSFDLKNDLDYKMETEDWKKVHLINYKHCYTNCSS